MVEICDISFAYDKKAGNILENISFDIKENRCIAILGNNGAGKSTLLKCINRINPADKGTVMVNGRNVYTMTKNDMAKSIAYVPQSGSSQNMTVFDAVLLGRKPYIKWDASKRDKEIVYEIIRKMNIEDLLLRNIAQLSGGELQKVMLARALAQEPGLLLLDEPTSNLDPKNQHEVLRIVKEIAAKQNTCVVVIIHDLNLAARYCDRFLFLKDSGIFSYGGIETMTSEIIEKVYSINAHVIHHMGIPVIIPFPDVKYG